MSFGETIFLFVLALIVFGPKKLPEIARQMGKYLNEFRRASNEFRSQIEQEIAHLDREDARKILPPSEAPAGATSRGVNPADPVAGASESAATLAAHGTETADSSVKPAPSITDATEAGPEPDKLATTTSQETHA